MPMTIPEPEVPQPYLLDDGGIFSRLKGLQQQGWETASAGLDKVGQKVENAREWVDGLSPRTKASAKATVKAAAIGTATAAAVAVAGPPLLASMASVTAVGPSAGGACAMLQSAGYTQVAAVIQSTVMTGSVSTTASTVPALVASSLSFSKSKGENEERAACKLQGAWRQRKARQKMRQQARQQYRKMWDNDNNRLCYYYMNLRTRVAADKKPLILGSEDLDDPVDTTEKRAKDEAACQLQGMWRQRKARDTARQLQYERISAFDADLSNIYGRSQGVSEKMSQEAFLQVLRFERKLENERRSWIREDLENHLATLQNVKHAKKADKTRKNFVKRGCINPFYTNDGAEDERKALMAVENARLYLVDKYLF
mmetsp:Transcript_27102/g.54085  ORF Transcript_27102/g.54085 Transcript_27102/m.54085 type:complete len:370 (+) Transcript_27102:211-1320(+)|eukprot:CAMPEP_0182464156 /NCGR_PEP_ID=MMETSP1319-20130603/8343_1 /TAXON_ID=172717 /ORGANISM="Bolidomonas pacifica, Strain RCC208" /LENGTH=369 /DNA_ID=CAMNT_0024663777 /DNA_START=196 /DNA_END=1305 /DNA_ORIENTATION=+